MPYRFLIIGAGLSGSVLARELAERMDCYIEIWEEKNHIAGNCYTAADPETGIMVHHYGPHIFNTDKSALWDYVNRFTEFHPYIHRVKALAMGKLYSFPVNLTTLNQYFDKTFTPSTASEWLRQIAENGIQDPKNFEDQALKIIGRRLYDTFYYGYTKKQWGCEPALLPASVMKRLPVRFNDNDNYHMGHYTGIPVKGYTQLIEQLIDHPSIQWVTNKKFLPEMDVSAHDHVFYTGPLDAWFHHDLGRLGYRTLRFETERHTGDFQGVAQLNFCDEHIPWTRITEHKHLAPWRHFEQTIITREYSIETGKGDVPFYPKRLREDKMLLLQYRQRARDIVGISFLGRLATYRYLDMQHVIEESIDFAEKFSEAIAQHEEPPVFPNEESDE